MKKILFFILFGVCLLLISCQMPDQLPGVLNELDDDEIENWPLFESPELDISFKYPAKSEISIWSEKTSQEENKPTHYIYFLLKPNYSVEAMTCCQKIELKDLDPKLSDENIEKAIEEEFGDVYQFQRKTIDTFPAYSFIRKIEQSNYGSGALYKQRLIIPYSEGSYDLLLIDGPTLISFSSFNERPLTEDETNFFLENRSLLSAESQLSAQNFDQFLSTFDLDADLDFSIYVDTKGLIQFRYPSDWGELFEKEDQGTRYIGFMDEAEEKFFMAFVNKDSIPTEANFLNPWSNYSSGPTASSLMSPWGPDELKRCALGLYWVQDCQYFSGQFDDFTYVHGSFDAELSQIPEESHIYWNSHLGDQSVIIYSSNLLESESESLNESLRHNIEIENLLKDLVFNLKVIKK